MFSLFNYHIHTHNFPETLFRLGSQCETQWIDSSSIGNTKTILQLL